MGKIKVTPCDIKGLYVIEPTVFKDEIGRASCRERV